MKKTIAIVVIMSFLLSAIPLNTSGEAINEEAQNSAGNPIYIPSNNVYAPGELIVKFKHGVNINLQGSTVLEGIIGTNDVIIEALDKGAISSGLPNEKNELIPVKPDLGGITSEETIEGTGVAAAPLDQETITTGIESVDILNSEYGVYSARKLRTDDSYPASSNIYVLKLPTDSDIPLIAEEYTNDINVDYAEPNYYYYLFDTIGRSSYMAPTETINDPGSILQWWLNNEGQTGGTEDADIDAPEAWFIEKGDPDITIAIVDTGVDYTHPDLADNIWTNNDEIPDNGIDDDGNGYIDDIRGWNYYDDSNDPLDIYGHGTHCSGIASAVTNNGFGVAGVSWNCKIMAITLDFSENIMKSASTVEAIYYAAENGADVISMSWGGNHHSTSLYEALKFAAYERNVVLVASAGNYNNDAEMFPAAYPFIISVGATDHNDERAIFSSYGKTVDVAAPGVEIYSTMPSYHTVMNDVGYDMFFSGMSGTSMSSPCVAGLAALLLSKNKDYTNLVGMVRTMIINTVDPIDSEKYIGRGRINAYNAVNKEPAIALMNPFPDWIDENGYLYISGWAWGESFQEYTLYYKYGDTDSWTEIKSSTNPVKDNTLATLNKRQVETGVYKIKLTVTCSDGVYTDETEIIITKKAAGVVIIEEVALNLEAYTVTQETVNAQSTTEIEETQQSLPRGTQTYR